MTDDDRKRLRLVIASAVLEMPDRFPDHDDREITVEAFGALISLAAYMSRNNLHITRAEFLEVCEAVADERP